MFEPGTTVTTTRTDVHYIVTEYGVANLRAKSLRERARLLINIAHPEVPGSALGSLLRTLWQGGSVICPTKKIEAVNGHTLQKVFLSVEDHIAVMTLHNPPVNAADGVVQEEILRPVRLYQP